MSKNVLKLFFSIEIGWKKNVNENIRNLLKICFTSDVRAARLDPTWPGTEGLWRVISQSVLKIQTWNLKKNWVPVLYCRIKYWIKIFVNFRIRAFQYSQFFFAFFHTFLRLTQAPVNIFKFWLIHMKDRFKPIIISIGLIFKINFIGCKFEFFAPNDHFSPDFFWNSSQDGLNMADSSSLKTDIDSSLNFEHFLVALSYVLSN